MDTKKQNQLLPTRERFSWWRSPWFGYPICVFFAGILVLAEKIDAYFPNAPIFVGTPFALLSILAAVLWGLGPAIFTMVCGLVVIAAFLSPGLFTWDLPKDFIIAGPFLLLQLLAIGIVLSVEHARRKLLVAHRTLEVTHRELLESHTQLERANDLKDYIITRSSHELRTSLTTILGRSQLLSARLKKWGETPENWTALQNYVGVVELRALHLRALIDSLFDLSRVRARNIPLRGSAFDFGELCRNVIADQRDLSGRVIELDQTRQAMVLHANEELLSQVVVNLVSNAIKYSPEDSLIHVDVRFDEHQLTLSVHNECPALAPEQLAHLFEPFYRTAEVEYSSIPGWGLGLTICKEIVEQYGGHIRAESSAGKGITFFVTLPLPARVEPGDLSAQSNAEGNADHPETAARGHSASV